MKWKWISPWHCPGIDQLGIVVTGRLHGNRCLVRHRYTSASLPLFRAASYARVMNRYVQLHQLGDGTYGSVALAHRVDTGEKVAIKKWVFKNILENRQFFNKLILMIFRPYCANRRFCLHPRLMVLLLKNIKMVKANGSAKCSWVLSSSYDWKSERRFRERNYLLEWFYAVSLLRESLFFHSDNLAFFYLSGNSHTYLFCFSVFFFFFQVGYAKVWLENRW